MFRQTYQSGLLSILSSQGAKPLQTWICKVSNGYIKRITDEDTKSLVIELISNNVSSTYVTCPSCPTDSLGIKMQYLNLYVKNLRRYFVMEIEVLDSGRMHRRFKISTFATKTKVGPFGTHSPLSWIEGWNRLALNLDSFTRTVYGTNYVECRRITIHANCRIRRVFFADREYREEELPLDYQIRCRIERTQRHAPVRQRMFAAKKTKRELDPPAKMSQTVSNEQKVTVEQAPNDEDDGEPMIKTPQGSMASEIPPVDELSDNDRNSENDYHTPIDVRDPPIADEISQLKLDVDEKPLDELSFSSNAYQQVRQRFVDRFHRQSSN